MIRPGAFRCIKVVIYWVGNYSSTLSILIPSVLFFANIHITPLIISPFFANFVNS